MELIARFELAQRIALTRFRCDAYIRSLALAQIEVASSNTNKCKKAAAPVGATAFLELIARFELATSSLPRMRSTD